MLRSSLDGSMGSYDKIIKSSSSDKWRWVKPSLCALAALGLVATAFGGIALGLPNSAIGQALSDRNIRIILTGVGGAAVTGAVAGRILTQHFQGKQPYRETGVVREESLIPDTPSLPVPGTGYGVADPRARSDLIGYESIAPTKKGDKRNPRTLIKERLEAAMNAKKEIFTFATGSSVHEEYGLIGRTIMHENSTRWGYTTVRVYTSPAPLGDAPRVHWDGTQYRFGEEILASQTDGTWSMSKEVAAKAIPGRQS